MPFRCQICGGDFESDQLPVIDFHQMDNDLPGIWKYRHSFYSGNIPVISMGEGDTPLIPLDLHGDVWGKLEYLNPTGSYKDRAMSLIVSQVKARGGFSAVEDSSGNAGASFAAYAARAGIEGKVFVPSSTSHAKINQISIYGAAVTQVDGPRSAAAEAVLKAAETGSIYASHAYLPFGLPGIATIAYELYLQLGKQVPGSVIAPVGHGHLLRGIVDGFMALRQQGYIHALPDFIGVQAERCAPIANAWKHGDLAFEAVVPQHTVAEGAAVTEPRQGNALLQLLSGGIGSFIIVSEEEIMNAFTSLAGQGVFVEPTSAMVWAAYQQLKSLESPAVLILTGNGLKYTIGE
jgi:threonine synthase